MLRKVNEWDTWFLPFLSSLFAKERQTREQITSMQRAECQMRWGWWEPCEHRRGSTSCCFWGQKSVVSRTLESSLSFTERRWGRGGLGWSSALHDQGRPELLRCCLSRWCSVSSDGHLKPHSTPGVVFISHQNGSSRRAGRSSLASQAAKRVHEKQQRLGKCSFSWWRKRIALFFRIRTSRGDNGPYVWLPFWIPSPLPASQWLRSFVLSLLLFGVSSSFRFSLPQNGRILHCLVSWDSVLFFCYFIPPWRFHSFLWLSITFDQILSPELNASLSIESLLSGKLDEMIFSLLWR